MLWSQIIYGHRTASISPKIVRFYGARTTQKKILKNRPVPGRLSNSPVICKSLKLYDVSFICDRSISNCNYKITVFFIVSTRYHLLQTIKWLSVFFISFLLLFIDFITTTMNWPIATQ